MVSKTFRIAWLTVAAAVTCVSSAPAAIIASYNFSTNSNSADTDIDSTAAAFAYNGGDTGRSSSGNAFIRTTVTGADLAAALADTHFISFTVTAVAPHTLNLGSLTFDFGGSTDGSGFTANMIVQSSVGGFGTGKPVLFESSQAVAGHSQNFSAGSIDLTAPAFQGLTAITFQFRFYDVVNNLGQVDRLDNVVLNNIPEPATLALLGVGGLLLTFRRARRPSPSPR